MKFFQDPRSGSHRTVHERHGQGLRLRRLLHEIAAAKLHRGLRALDPGCLGGCLRRRRRRAKADHIEMYGLATAFLVDRAMIKSEPGCDHAAPVAALSEIGVIAKNFSHKCVPQLGSRPLPQRRRWFSRESISRKGRNNEIERIFRLPAILARVGERADRVEEFEE